MFEKKEQAEARVIALEGPGHVVDTDMHGVDWEHRKYILEVRPAGQQAFRVETKAKVPIFSKPEEGDVVTVSYEPHSHKTEFIRVVMAPSCVTAGFLATAGRGLPVIAEAAVIGVAKGF